MDEPQPIFSYDAAAVAATLNLIGEHASEHANVSENAKYSATTSTLAGTTMRVDASVDDSEDDCVLIGTSVPNPLPSTREGLVKREQDVLSGDTPFINTVSSE